MTLFGTAIVRILRPDEEEDLPAPGRDRERISC